MRPFPSDSVWKAYNNRKPVKVPVVLGVNPRIILLDPKLNTENVSFKDYFEDASIAIRIQRKFFDYAGTVINRYTDYPEGIPEKYGFFVDWMNTYDALYFGAKIEFRDGQVPDATVAYADDSKRRDIFNIDIDHPLDNGFIKQTFTRYEKLKTQVEQMNNSEQTEKYAVNLPLVGFDGPFTVAMNLRGTAFLTDIYEDPDYAHDLLQFITEGAIKRRKAMAKQLGIPDLNSWFADDSIAMISPKMYDDLVKPLHEKWYESSDGTDERAIHLCGNATHHFPVLVRDLKIGKFDTGFPVDHGALRKALGPDIEIAGGPKIDLLLQGKPDEVYQTTKSILTSGVKEGGRFILREANNLPPCVPLENLEAMYRASVDYGMY